MDIDFAYPWDKIGDMLLKEWLSGERGRAAKLARHLHIPPSMVAKMAAGKKPIPLEHTPRIQEFTAGQVTCEELRPDAADFFALVRRQQHVAGVPAIGLPDGVPRDRRRDSATASSIVGTMLDRRGAFEFMPAPGAPMQDAPAPAPRPLSTPGPSASPSFGAKRTSIVRHREGPSATGLPVRDV